MEKKYIVKLDDNKLAYTAIIIDGVPYIKPLQLLPYTEPDMEQVGKDGYENGYENGFVAGHLKAEKSGQSFYEDGYRCGLNDAWGAARKINCLPSSGGIKNYVLGKIFGHTSNPIIMEKFSASECIEKIRQYEQEKEEQIQVGDEIETPSGLKGYVVNFTDDELVHYVSSEGRFGTMGTSAVSKTGRHFPEIVEVLQKMKEANNG